ncbi:hypothetical protein [Cohnella zeiphila]|uniref:Uncharacterized protein n=1 Tax=Cohnella zeiphila TaxID=2761120 RepID=A0A7X0SRC4_9BACL|nr:hypothetical protein [Cohnella zeiphila]MBB6734644.1 hypothetical protein [Cohnella zeiphila]
MKLLFTLSLALIVWGLFRYDWPRMNAGMKKEKTAFIGIIAVAAFLSILLIWFPRIPSAMKMIDLLFGPLGSILKT